MGYRHLTSRFHRFLTTATKVLLEHMLSIVSVCRTDPRGVLTVLSVLVMPMSACEAQNQNSAQQKADPSLICKISGKESYRSGTPAVFDFRLENRSTQAIYIVKWHTPLEGIMNRVFTVTRDGKQLEYQGLMARRGSPLAEDYVSIAPGEAVTASFDLGKFYDLTAPGVYQLEFISKILDMTTKGSDIPRTLECFEPLDIQCNILSFSIRE